MKQLNGTFDVSKNQKGFLSHEEQIRKLEETKAEVNNFTYELDEKLRKGEITGIEHNIILNEKLGTTNKKHVLDQINQKITEEKEQLKDKTKEKRRKAAIAISLATIIIIIGSITGIIIQEPTNIITGQLINEITETENTIIYERTYTQNTQTQINITNLKSIKISGLLEGSGARIKIISDNKEYLIAELNNKKEYELTTDKKEYSNGETVTITIKPTIEEDTNTSIYIEHNNERTIIEENKYVPKQTGEYKIIALITTPEELIRKETNFTVTNTTNTTNNTTNEEPESIIEETLEFENLCQETCNTETINNPTLIIELEEKSKLTITKITITQNNINKAPTQTKIIPDIEIKTETEKTLDLNQYFTDPEKDTIYYDINEITEIETNFNQEQLTIKGTNLGTYEAIIYATDGNQLTTSNTFTITITKEETTTQENTTNNTTTNETLNTTIDETNNKTTNTTNTTINTTNDPCTEPDINKRPSYCFIGIEEQAFEQLTIELQNKKRTTIGRFTRFGNLIIKGLVIKNSTNTPEADDFQVGYVQRQAFKEINTPTAWIDTETGNLHLKGNLYENIELLEPGQFNTYIIRNQYNLILGYFNEVKGDLYLRGNIVQLGEI